MIDAIEIDYIPIDKETGEPEHRAEWLRIFDLAY